MKRLEMNIKRVIALIVVVLGFLVGEVSAQTCNSPTQTPFNTNNGQDGIMFTITAKRAIVIDSFHSNFANGNINQFLIYYKYGTATGFQTTPGAWTLLGSVSGTFTSNGVNNATPIPINCNFPMAKYQTVAFYVTTNGATGTIMRYTNGGGACDSLGGNPDMVLHEGYGKDYPFGATFTPREFNGRVYYHCVTDPTYSIVGNLFFCNISSGQQETYYINPPIEGDDIYWSLPSGVSMVGNGNNDTITVQFNTTAPSGPICASIIGCDAGDTVATICENLVSQPPQADAGPDTSICGVPYQLQGNQGTGTWTVLSGSGTFANANLHNTTVTGLAQGNNELIWTVGGNGCPITSDTVTIDLDPQAVANFTFNDVCDGIPMSLNDNSYALGGSIVGWEWDVDGDATTDYTTSSVSHTFTDSGNYEARLIITASNGGCKDTITKTVRVNPLPETDFTFDPECEMTPTPFTDLSTIGTGSVVGWNWNFGDGSTSNVQSPTHTYASDGEYTVNLMAISDKGCTAFHADTVEVYTLPEPIISVDPVCQNDTAEFVDLSTSVQGVINYWEWNFGDSSSVVNTQNTEHHYLNHGTYQVELLVATDKGCTNTVVTPLDIYPIPIPKFKQDGKCERQTVSFTDDSELSGAFGSTLVDWVWEFGDGNSASNKTVANFYQQPGYYTVTHTPYTNYGCSVTVETEILIRPKPRANILIKNDHVCAGNEIDFQDETYFDYTYDAIGVTDWEWTFGDGAGSNVADPSHTYAKGGEYPTRLIVETNHGCIDSAEKVTIVHHNPVADFRPDTLEGCSPHCVTFIDRSQIAGNDEMVYAWTFGDGQTGSAVIPTYCYEIEEGLLFEEFPVTLTVTTPEGCTDTYKHNEKIVVHSNPAVDFILGREAYSMLEPNVEITNTSMGGDFWLWNFGDGTTSEIAHPFEHTYDSAGIYTIRLEAETDFGCTGSKEKRVHVRPHQVIYIPNSFTPNGDGINDFFEVKGEDLEFVRLWVYDRWGKEVFYGANEQAAWDGRVDGQLATIGTYAYVIEYKMANLPKNREYGNFMITRTDEK